MSRFAGRVALVTGAASGIGRATAERLAAEGARLVIGDVRAAELEGVAADLAGRGAEVRALPLDVTDPLACRRSVDTALEAFGGLHVLCNIAGILHFENTHDLDLEDWRRVVEVNLTGTFLMCRAAIPALLEARGAIVNTSSTAAIKGHAWMAAYSASKGGVLALTYSLAIEYGGRGLRVNAVLPGAIRTPIQDAFRVPEGADAKLVRRIMPLTGFGEPGDAASVIAFLASEEARHINGEGVRVDGAMCV